MNAAFFFFCATVGFSLESANVVGYQNNALTTGYSMITPSFVNVDSTDYAIDSLLLDGVEDRNATVQVVNSDGSWGTQGFWFNEFIDGADVYPAGWFLADGETPANITLKPGESVFFYTTAKNGKAQSSGQVANDVTVNLKTGYSMLGNSTPLNMPIDNLLLEGVDDRNATVQVVNADGSWGTQGFWFNEFVDGADVYPAGWFLADGETPANITLNPGESVFFYTTAKNGKATIPSALK